MTSSSPLRPSVDEWIRLLQRAIILSARLEKEHSARLEPLMEAAGFGYGGKCAARGAEDEEGGYESRDAGRARIKKEHADPLLRALNDAVTSALIDRMDFQTQNFEQEKRAKLTQGDFAPLLNKSILPALTAVDGALDRMIAQGSQDEGAADLKQRLYDAFKREAASPDAPRAQGLSVIFKQNKLEGEKEPPGRNVAWRMRREAAASDPAP